MKTKFVDPVHDSDVTQNVMGPSLVCATPCHQVLWKSSYCTVLLTDRQTTEKIYFSWQG